MREWSFLTNHATVLNHIAEQSGSTVHQIASVTGISNRALYKIIADLFNAGYISKRREDGEFRYSVNPDLPLCPDIPQRQTMVWDLSEALGWERE